MAVFINRQAKALLSLSIALKIKYRAIFVVYGSGISFKQKPILYLSVTKKEW